MFFKKKPQNVSTGLIPSPKDDRDYALSSYMPDVKRYPKEKPLPFDLKIHDQTIIPSCFPGNAQILTEDFSYRPIKEISVGDYVFTHKGRLKRVTETFKKRWQGTMRIIKIWGDYREIEATPEHPIYAIKRPGGSRWKNSSWVKTEELLDDVKPDFYAIDELSKGDWVAMPFNDVIKDKTIYSFEKDPEFLWVLGLYLAEGSVREGEVTFSLHIKETDFYERVKSAMEKYGVSVTYSLYEKESGLIIRISNKKWSNIFLELGSKLCENKKINKRLMFLEPHLQMKIIEGFTDGDGYIRRKNNKTLVSTSYKLLEQIRTILLRKGIYSSFQKRKDRKDRKPVWVLEYYDNNKCGFIKDGYYFALIKSNETKRYYVGNYVYNFEVEDDNSYIVNSIAVHNCVGMSCAAIKEGNERLEKVNKVFDGHWIYYKCKEIDNYSGDGTYLRTGMKVLKDTGAKTGDEDPAKYRIKAYARVDDVSFEGLKRALSIYHFLIAGFKGSNEGWKKEVIRPPKPGEKEWGHAVTLVGYDEDHIIGQNSWGDYYWVHNDSGGYFKTTKDYLPFEAWAVLLDAPNDIKTVESEVRGYVAYEFTKVEKGDIVVNTKYGLRLREKPTTESPILDVLPYKTKIKTTGELSYSNGWNWLPVLK